MKRITRYARPMGLLLALLVLAGAAAAQNRGRMMGRPAASEFQRFSLSLAGGFGFQERGCGLADLKAELQYGFSRSLRLGFSVGYLTRGDRDDMMDREGRGRMNGGMMMDNARLSTMLFPRQEQEFGRDARAIPLGLNLYYTLPLGRRWSASLWGGGIFAFGSFRAAENAVHKKAFGGQTGLGFEYSLTSKVRLTAEAGYRFLTFTRVRPPQPELSPLLRMIANTVPAWMMPQPKPVDVSLNGCSVRAGVKFGL
jgi:opacity protein-like surface antigen